MQNKLPHTHLTPLGLYHRLLQQHTIEPNEQQLKVIEHLQTLYAQLIQPSSWLTHMRNKLQTPTAAPGIYLWGDVGVGKTFLMDIFYDCLPIDIRMRTHFYQFMRSVHTKLKERQGITDPLVEVAHELAAKTKVICLDEFFITDIADAMLMHGLLNSLMAQGICLITTSNIPPNELYKDGLQRERFLPTIELIKQHTHVIELTSEIDYRLNHKAHTGHFYTPINEESRKNMEQCFDEFSHHHPVTTHPIEILGRSVNLVKQSSSVIWFDFIQLCDSPRSQNDYLFLAEKYHTVMISKLRQITAKETHLISNFIKLIDVLYDARVRVVISSQVDMESIYPEGRLAFEFKRTHSRLIEMQSSEYFENPQAK